ncbi:hypothetical protein [Occultella gossypii]|uniref:Uncharacterized protein n=1 Tax=Occultella gossypii TaxID=2800820 RepID=A0ABS7SEF8_9MICO|nr:hypothetical protein [Occultella gossypii]MBZ2198734.1 hypothetical protein [Occultella gossypii]
MTASTRLAPTSSDSPTAPGPAVTLWEGTAPDTDQPNFPTYARELLAHAGITHHATAGGAGLTPGGIALLTTPVTSDEAGVLSAWVAGGGYLLVTGDLGPVARLAGVVPGEFVPTAQVTVRDCAFWSQVPGRALRAIGGRALAPAEGTDTLATWADGAAAITVRHHGAGAVVAFGADVLQSVVRIQQGYPVHTDGTAAADGTTPIDDGILKAEDGAALDLDADRAMPPGQPDLAPGFLHAYPPPSAVPMFDQPHADWWRSLLLQAVWWAAQEGGAVVPWLGYWPAGIAAIAHMSHDSDGNEPEDGLAALAAFAEAEVAVTWCQVFPGGYGPEIYEQITDAGHEHALHYNAMDDADLATWGWPQMRAQYSWAQAVTGREDIVSNKNHYTRWEGWDEFYTWCERLGIKIDQSRGPSKQGNVGFPFGTAHVSFPLAAPGAETDFRDVLNLPLHTQDLAWAGHVATRDVILDAVQAQHGVAHFLFHGPHLNGKPLTRAACVEVAAEARRRGMPWWTAEQINDWERTRRRVRVEISRGGSDWLMSATTDVPVEGVAILLPTGLRVSGPKHSAVEVTRHGRAFTELAVDLPAGTSTWTLTR